MGCMTKSARRVILHIVPLSLSMIYRVLYRVFMGVYGVYGYDPNNAEPQGKQHGTWNGTWADRIIWVSCHLECQWNLIPQALRKGLLLMVLSNAILHIQCTTTSSFKQTLRLHLWWPVRFCLWSVLVWQRSLRL